MTFRRHAATLAGAALLLLAGCSSAEPPAPPTPVTGTDTPGSLEGFYTQETMDEFLEVVTDDLLEPWFVAAWPDATVPEVSYVPAGQTGAGCSATDQSVAYCPDDQTVYVGQTALWNLYSHSGDAGPAVLLAHEYGRAVKDDPVAAYCLAGSWVRFADENGLLETGDDLQDIEQMLTLTGATNDSRTAYQSGVANGTAACLP